jgi:hypothetical protein
VVHPLTALVVYVRGPNGPAWEEACFCYHDLETEAILVGCLEFKGPNDAFPRSSATTRSGAGATRFPLAQAGSGSTRMRPAGPAYRASCPRKSGSAAAVPERTDGARSGDRDRAHHVLALYLGLFLREPPVRTPAIVWTLGEAREGRLKSLAEAPRVLHLATHGFYLNPGEGSHNRLLDSGLALAGANQRLLGKTDPEVWAPYVLVGC